MYFVKGLVAWYNRGYGYRVYRYRARSDFGLDDAS